MPQSIVELSEQLEGTDFQKDLLTEFVTRGLGSLPGRETTVVLVGLLIKHHPSWKDIPPKDYELARLLKTSPRKIRNIRDELSYRDESRTDEQLRNALKALLQNEVIGKGDQGLKIQIDDGLLRDFVCDQLRRTFNLVEYGNNLRVLNVSADSLVALGLTALTDAEMTDLAKKIELVEQPPKGEDVQPQLRKLFLESFVKASGDELGKQASSLISAIASGGLSQLLNLLKNIGLGQH